MVTHLEIRMKQVIYCDFQVQDAHGIGQEVRQFLKQLQNLTGWDVLEVRQNQVWFNDQPLGSAPAEGSWLDCLTCALETASPDLVFIWFNDLIPTRWSDEQVGALFQEARVLMEKSAANPQYIRLNAYPPALGNPLGLHFRVIDADEAYQCALPASIWRTDYLIRMCFGLNSAWALETQVHQGLALSARGMCLPSMNMMLRGRPNVAAFFWRNQTSHCTARDCVHSLIWWAKYWVSLTLQWVAPRFYHCLYRKLHP